MEGIVRSINDALDCAKIRLAWYSITGDNQYMDECKEWQNIAGIYMDQLVTEETNESCKSGDGINY